MSQAIAYRGRLPGLRCDPALPAPVDEAIRLDVAAFVGFAERGPVDDPQPIDDAAQYTTVFGGDVPLALDERGVVERAALPDAVASFFVNGGRRAYVVRVVGASAVALPLPARVVARRPLHDGLAAVGVTTGAAPATLVPGAALTVAPLLDLPAATCGGWARRVSIDVDVIDTVLGLATAADGRVDLIAGSQRLLDAGDAVLVWRGGTWLVLWTEKAGAAIAPPGGWLATDVARLLRADISVRRSADGATTVVEQFRNLRLGLGRDRCTARTPGWSDVLQRAAGGFGRDRSMYARAAAGDCLLPVFGAQALDVLEPRSVVGPAPFAANSLDAEGLAAFDPAALFLDPTLHGHTVDGLRLALEALGLDDDPHAHGIHAVALQHDVAMLAAPDLYHRPWALQFLPPDPVVAELPAVDVPPPVGFAVCDPPAPAPSAPSPAPTPIEPRYVLLPPDPAQLGQVTTVAAAIADLCAARADMVGVLALPRWATVDDADRLATTIADRPMAGVDPTSYVGLWHPWTAIAEGATPALAPVRFVPPDGAACAAIAATELATGVWIEPAGRPVLDALDVDPLDLPGATALFDRGCNVMRRTPAGFVATSAHTLSADRTLLQLSVRRLLIWLRLLALREGTRLVFEPDDERFRVQVATLFGRVLERLRVVGALAAYRVDVAPLAARPGSQDGQVRIDLRVAPSSPIEFITVTLLRSGADVLEVGGT